MEPPIYGYYDYLELYYESYYEKRHARLINETCHDRSLSSLYYNSSNFINPLCAQIRNMTAYDHPSYRFAGEIVVPPLASIAVVCCIASMMVAAVFFYRLMEAMKKPDKPDKITIALGSSCMIFHVIYNILDPIALWFYLVEYQNEPNHIIMITEETFWGLSKVTIYSLFAYRYFILSRASIFKQSSQYTTLISFGSVICCIFIQLSLQIAYIIVLDLYANVDWLDSEGEAYYHRLYLNIGWMFSSIDFVIVGCLGFLIIRTVLRLVIMIDFHSDRPELSVNSVQSVSSTGAVPSLDDYSAAANEAEKSKNKRKKKLNKKKNRRQKELIELSTRLALTCLFSMISSFIVYSTQLVVEEAAQWHLSFVTYFWCLDNVINMLCVYFSMAFAKHHYKIACGQYCLCHQCFHCCLDALVSIRIDKKHQREQDAKLERSGGVVTISISTNSSAQAKGEPSKQSR
eukprot:737011_1